MSIFNIGKSLLYKHPKLIRISSYIYNICFFNHVKVKGKNNKINRAKSFMKKCKITIIGNNNYVELGEMTYFHNTKITIYGNNNKVCVGNKVYASQGDFYIENDDNSLTIQEKTIFAGNVHLALTEGKKIEIGKDCLFSSNIVFRTGDSHSILDKEGNRTNSAKDITIGNHVWITQNVTVLKGTSVSENSVIATGSILTKEFKEENVLIAGNPAKIIKSDINWCNERK